MSNKVLALESLSQIPICPSGAHISILQKCVVSLCSQNHDTGVCLLLKVDDQEFCYTIEWEQQNIPILWRAHKDLFESVEDSARALAFLLIEDLTSYKIFEQAERHGTGFDYWLSPDLYSDSLPFQNAARLEITGILSGTEKMIQSRLREKVLRLEKAKIKASSPVYIVVVEHSNPIAHIEKVII